MLKAPPPSCLGHLIPEFICWCLEVRPLGGHWEWMRLWGSGGARFYSQHSGRRGRLNLQILDQSIYGASSRTVRAIQRNLVMALSLHGGACPQTCGHRDLPLTWCNAARRPHLYCHFNFGFTSLLSCKKQTSVGYKLPSLWHCVTAAENHQDS